MRLLSVYYTHKPGGFCKRLYRLLNALAAAGHEVHYLTLDQPPPGSLSTNVCVDRLPFPFKARRGLLFWALFTTLAPLYVFTHAFRQRTEHVVVFGAYYSAMSVCTSALRIPTILFLRSLVFRIDAITGKPWFVRRCAKLVERIGITRAAQVVCMTQTMRREVEEFLGRPLARCEILPNDLPVVGSSAPRTLSPAIGHLFSPERFTVVCAGVLDRRKNVTLLLRALATLPPNLPPWQLIVAGEGPERAPLEKESQALGLTQVHFVGWLQPLEPLIQHSQLLIHPALHEGVPNVIMEALAIGVPVLAADIPEHRDILHIDTLLFSLTDPTKLGERIAELITSPHAYSNLRRLSGDAAAPLRFDWDSRATQIVMGSSPTAKRSEAPWSP